MQGYKITEYKVKIQKAAIFLYASNEQSEVIS